MKKIDPIDITPDTQNISDKPIIKELEPVSETKITISLPMIIFAIAVIIGGGITGYVLAGGGGRIVNVGGQKGGPSLKNEIGLAKDKAGEDIAEGILKEGGIDGEGSHHLEREGGPSQNVYLTSSVILLDDYINQKVKVFGITFQAEKAGWFMDVGRLEVLE